MRIAPSILASDLAFLALEIKAVEEAGADLIHIDVMDGRFVPNISFGMPLVESVRPITTLPLDVHLMIVEPERYIESFAASGADIITVHSEACCHLERVLQQIRSLGCKAGVALNPSTSPESIRYCMHCIDLVLIMTVNPGFGGQSLLPETLSKIGEVRNMAIRAGVSIDIEVDGGVNHKTSDSVRRAGADILVAGSAIFSREAEKYKQKIDFLRGSLS